MSKRAEDLSFLLITSGSAESVPASAFRDWLLKRGARVNVLVHPLAAADGGYHVGFRYAHGRLVSQRRVRLPSRPPATYPLDLLVPPLLPRGEVVIAFNNLQAARALISRPRRTVVYCAVDFVPHRFGEGTLITRAFEVVDRWVCRRVDARFELSQTGLEERNRALGLTGRAATAHVVPVGAWLDRVPQVPEDGYASRRVVFMGHLVERMGVDTLLEAVALLRDRGVPLGGVDIIGHGPLEGQLRLRCDQLSLSQMVRWHGFVADHRDLEVLLSEASVAAAPYSTQVESFTRFADPGKIKSYLAAGLPILMTDVPPNAHDVAEHGGAEIVEDSPQAFAEAIERLLSDEQLWRQRRADALSYVQRFDWNLIIPQALAAIDIVSDGPELDRAAAESTSSRTVGQRLTLSIVRAARRAFTGTPIERLPVTGWLRTRLFRAAYGGDELETTIRGLTLSLPGGDVSMVPSLVWGYHEELELAIYERIAGGSSLIADVGANVGLYSCVGAAAMPSGSVIAFEPAPANLAFLRRNLVRNGLEDRVVVVAQAVSDATGSARFFLSDGIGNHSLAFENAGSEQHLDVSVTTIDDYFAGRRVDVLKVDVEGFDAHVLSGARETLKAHHPAVFVELLTEHLQHSGISPQDLVALLADSYEHIFVVDNVRQSLRESTREELLALAEQRVHTNLIAVSRPEHVAALDEFIKR